MSSRKEVQELADRLISTLSGTMPSEKADAIVHDVATALYNNVLGIPGSIQAETKGIACGSFGMANLSTYKFVRDIKNE